MTRIPKEPINSNDYARSQMVKELLGVKEWNSHISFFHIDDLQDTLNYFCTYKLQYVGLIPAVYLLYADWGLNRCICAMSFESHSLFLHAFINWYQVLGLCSHRTSSVYSPNRLQGDISIYPVCVPYWNVIYILSCLYFLFLCNPYNIATWTTCIYYIYTYITMCF